MKRQDSKICAVCNRPMTWRRKWAKSWDEVKYCSEACRRNKKSPEKALGNKSDGN